MSNAFDGLKPEVLWSSFQLITSTSRPSKHEEKIIAAMLKWAKEHKFSAKQDAAKNVIIKVPASKGMENKPAVVLQGHLDMVCEKNQDVEFDFMAKGIDVVRDGDWLKAKGTTLGADNGIGMAMAMALALDPDAKHPPLELLFTVDEETGLTGAFNLASDVLTGKLLINIDSEEEGVVFVGCAGGGDTETTFPLHLHALPAGYEVAVLRVRGLKGGHSGLTIHENRGNALKLMALWVNELLKTEDLHICKMTGGDKHNAIPREADLVVAGPKGISKALKAQMKATLAGFKQEFGTLETTVELKVETAEATTGLDVRDSKRLLQLILALPHGVEAMSRDIPGLVETSTNLARITWGETEAKLLNSSRSSVAFGITRMRETIQSIAEVAGVPVYQKVGYPGWQPNMKSQLLAKTLAVYKKVTGKDAHATAIHAGLECGIIGEKYDGMDMISIGPTMFDVHSPAERLSISSSERVYAFLKTLVASV